MKQETDASFSHLKISAVVYSLIFTMFSQLFYVQMCMYVCERDLRDKCVKNNIMIDNAHITCENNRWNITKYNITDGKINLVRYISFI